MYYDDLEEDADFWQNCVREWKRGSGYRDRLNRCNAGWFATDAGKEADARVVELITEEWSRTVTAAADLMPAHS